MLQIILRNQAIYLFNYNIYAKKVIKYIFDVGVPVPMKILLAQLNYWEQLLAVSLMIRLYANMPGHVV